MQRIYGNIDNVARTGTVAATDFVSSSRYRRTSATRTGGGQVTLSGDYTGDSDSTFDIEVLNDTIVGTPLISEPQYVGVGNGTMTNAAATSGTTARTITVTLVDLGTRTTQAYANLGPVTLQAQSSGTGGNDITITVDRSGLTFTESSLYTVPADIDADNDGLRGAEYDFGASTLLADGTLPSDATRFRFGHDPHVYRQYREYIDGEYVYKFSPRLKAAIPKGAKVFTVTGSMSATISDGTTTESALTGLVTLYDLLLAINTSSSLVEVSGAVTANRAPGGMDAIDLNLRTAPYVRSVEFDGSDYLDDIQTLSVDSDARTETIEVECIDASVLGSERWRVRGTSSGTLDEAITNVLYDGRVNFLIPTRSASSARPSGSIEVSLQSSNANLCREKIKALLGSRATTGTYTFTYRTRSDDCDGITVEGRPDETCLGVEVSSMVTGANAAIMRRAKAVEKYFSEIAESHISTDTVYTGDLNLLDLVRPKLLECLADLNTSGTLTFSDWVTATAYSEGDKVVATSGNTEWVFVAQNDGTSGGSEPSWSATAEGDTTSDNGITWEACKRPLNLFDDQFTALQSKLSAITSSPSEAYNDVGAETSGESETGSDVGAWQASTAYAGVGPWYVVPTTRNGHGYFVSSGGTSGGSEPTWPTDGSTVTDGTVIWRDLGTYWDASTAYAVNDRIDIFLSPSSNHTSIHYVCTTAGTSGSTEPTWTGTPDSITDGTVVWTREDVVLASGADTETLDEDEELAFAEAVERMFDEVRSAAGILNFDSASSAGTRCWRDTGAAAWWESNDGLLPAFTNVYYHSARERTDSSGATVLESTQEFGFAPALSGTPEDGDVITVKIANAQGTQQTYQAGDRISIEVVNAAPLPFGGGAAGDDQLTWSVKDSVDGALAEHTMDVTDSAAQSYSDSGISFDLTLGGIDWALGDQYTFAVEGGQFRWRQDGGSWSSNTQIGSTVSLADGVSAVFTVGAAPSFVDGDTYAFSAESVNGPQHTIQPTDGAMTWETSTTITITSGEAASELLIWHEIDSGSTITLQGSDDGFSTTPLNQSVTWNEGVISHDIGSTVTYAAYRLVITGSGSITWLWLGEPWYPARVGFARRRARIERDVAGLNSQGAYLGYAKSAEIEWGRSANTWLTSTESDELEAAVVHAARYDQARMGYLLSDQNRTEAAISIATLDEIEDVRGYQPDSAGNRLVGLTLSLEGVV